MYKTGDVIRADVEYDSQGWESEETILLVREPDERDAHYLGILANGVGCEYCRIAPENIKREASVEECSQFQKFLEVAAKVAFHYAIQISKKVRG